MLMPKLFVFAVNLNKNILNKLLELFKQ